MLGEEIEEDCNQRSDSNENIPTEVHIRWNLLGDNSLLFCWVVDILHHLVGLLGLFLAVKEDAHRRDSFILFEGVDEKTLALCLEGMNQMDINQTIPMSHIGRRDFHIVPPDIINSRHLDRKQILPAPMAYTPVNFIP